MYVNTTPARELANTEARITQLAGTNSSNRAELARLAVLREVWQERADEVTLDRWEHHQRLLWPSTAPYARSTGGRSISCSPSTWPR
jgi:hypothetical protein